MTIDVPTQFPKSIKAQSARIGQSRFRNVEGISSTGQQTIISELQTLITSINTANNTLTDTKTLVQGIDGLLKNGAPGTVLTTTSAGIVWAPAESYSLDEHLTGGVWIDGKPIYRKTIDTGGLPNATSKNVTHNITGLTWLVKMFGTAFDSLAQADFIVLPLVVSTAIANNVSLSFYPTYVSLATAVDRTSYTRSYVTLEYVK